jgi:serine/threonine protein kinase
LFLIVHIFLYKEYYARKRNVLFSVVQASFNPNSSVCAFITSLLRRDGILLVPPVSSSLLLSPRASAEMSSASASGVRYPISASEYNLIRPFRDSEGYSDSSGTLWEAMCLANNEMVAIKVVDNAVWKRMGKMPQQLIKRRRAIRTDKVVHFLQVFDDNNSCTWFVMPLYKGSAYQWLRKYPEIPTREMLCIVKLAVLALAELHAEGQSHGKITMRNILMVEEGNKVSVKLTNKASHIINTLIYRNITGANDTFSPARFAKALQDYDLGGVAGFNSSGGKNADGSDGEESEFSSSDTNTGTISFGTTALNTLAELVKKEERQLELQKQPDAQQHQHAQLPRPQPLHEDAVQHMQWIKISKDEDIVAVLRMLARVYDVAQRRVKELRERGGLNKAASLRCVCPLPCFQPCIVLT